MTTFAPSYSFQKCLCQINGVNNQYHSCNKDVVLVPLIMCSWHKMGIKDTHKDFWGKKSTKCCQIDKHLTRESCRFGGDEKYWYILDKLEFVHLTTQTSHFGPNLSLRVVKKATVTVTTLTTQKWSILTIF